MADYPDSLQPFGDGEAALDWIGYQPLAAIVAALEAAGGAPMFVGGCVRDSLIGRPPCPGQDAPGEAARTDIDIATVLRPEETVAALKAAGLKAVPTGLDHGTVTAVAEGFPAEVTTLRADVDTDGRHAQVAFTTDWDEDWRRRDFTINAMYLTPDRRLFDPAGGREALTAQRVAFIGDPATRLREDYLRILRFYRFSARYAAEIDIAGAAACRAERDGLSRISRERIGHEMMRILAGPRRAFILEAMAADGIFAAIYRQPDSLGLVRPLSELPGSDPEVMLAALWPGLGDDELASAFRLSNASTARRKGALKAAALMREAPEPESVRALVYRLGEQAFCDGLLIGRARAGEGDPEPWDDAASIAANWQVPDFPVTAEMMMQAGVKKGPALGAALKAAEAAWIARDFPDDPVSLQQIVEEGVQSSAD